MAEGKKLFGVYKVVSTGGEGGREAKEFWYRVGTGFEHKDGQGINVELAAIPIPEGQTVRLVLRAMKPGEDEGMGTGGKPSKGS